MPEVFTQVASFILLLYARPLLQNIPFCMKSFSEGLSLELLYQPKTVPTSLLWTDMQVVTFLLTSEAD